MDLFKLVGTIAINTTEAKNALSEVSDSGGKAESKLSKVFSGIGKGAAVVGKAVMTGMAVGGAAVAALATKSVQAYADYEQLVGGVETLFGTGGKSLQEYADSVGKTVEDVTSEYLTLKNAQTTVLDNASNAYKTAGMSANDYMETVTSFSAALISSLEGDTQKAATLADQAIVDMSDNANKMGSDIESIQNAYQGFAKQNYTMLDNLKLGYGGTKEEMARLLKDAEKISGVKYDLSSYADVVDAIHVIQTEMGITGTTANEASTTISGSISSMKASWENLLTAISSDDLPFDEYVNNFVDSVDTVADNLLPRISIALDGIVQLVSKLAPKLIAKIPELLNQLLPAAVSCVTQLISAIASTLPALAQTVIDILPDILAALQSIFTALVSALPELITTIVSALPTLIPMLVTGLVDMIVMLCTMLPQIILPIVQALPGIVISLVDALMENLPALIEGVVALVNGIVIALPEIIMALIEALPTIMQSIVTGLWNAWPTVLLGIISMFGTLVQAVVNLCSGLIKKIKEIWSKIKSAVSPYIEKLKTYLKSAWENIKTKASEIITKLKEKVVEIFNNLKTSLSTTVNNIKTKLVTTWTNIKTTVQEKVQELKTKLSTLWNSIKSTISTVVTNIKTKATTIFTNIKTSISNTVTGLKTKITTVFTAVKTTVSNVFTALKTKVTTVWNGIKTAITTPINTAKNTIKKAIDKIKGFFDFEISWPSIPMPHFGISPDGWKIGDLLSGSIPKLTIDWYAKAMNSPMIMNSPTVFGYDAATGKLLGGGEKGSEVVSGTSTLMGMIQAAVAGQNGGLAVILYKILDAILALDANMGGNLREAMAGTAFEVNKREFARLVKAVT